MSIRKKEWKFALLFVLVAALFVQCTKEEMEDSGIRGTLEIEITDAPIDDAEVSGAFVTVAEIKLDGKTFDGFSGKQTIDLLAYQNGSVKSLGLGEVEAGSYSNITLVLDHSTDANGDSPGCYVETTDGKKHDLTTGSTASQEITISNGDLTISENAQSTLLIDFDLRKTINRDDNSSDSGYSFVTTTELETGLRQVNKEEAGTVEGECSNSALFTDKVVVYAYPKGTYDKDLEASGQGSSQIQFKNATSSATVQADGSYSLHFLEAGDYEIIFVGYKDGDSDGRFELAGNLSVDITGSLNLNNVSVGAQSSTTLNVSATGILPF